MHILKLNNVFYNLIKKIGTDSDYEILYHIRNKHGLPYPKPSREPNKQWERNHLDEPISVDEPVIFLTNDPAAIYYHHGLRGDVFVYKVSKKIIKESHGLNKFDGANEIIITESLWVKGLSNGDIKLLGKKSSKWLKEKADEKYKNTSNHNNLNDSSKNLLKRLNKEEGPYKLQLFLEILQKLITTRQISEIKLLFKHNQDLFNDDKFNYKVKIELNLKIKELKSKISQIKTDRFYPSSLKDSTKDELEELINVLEDSKNQISG